MVSFDLGLLCLEQRATHKWPFKVRNDWHCPSYRTCHYWLLCDPVTAPGRASGGLEAPCLQVSGAGDTGFQGTPHFCWPQVGKFRADFVSELTRVPLLWVAPRFQWRTLFLG